MPSATVDISSPSGPPIPTLVLKVTRGQTTKLGTLVAANTAVVFSISEPTFNSQGFMYLQITGTAGTTAILECSIDGGATWFLMPTLTSLTVAGQLTGDAAATAAYAVNVSGLGGALFKYGYTGAGVPTAVVWALIG